MSSTTLSGSGTDVVLDDSPLPPPTLLPKLARQASNAGAVMIVFRHTT
jgi:hypothetical protein